VTAGAAFCVALAAAGVSRAAPAAGEKDAPSRTVLLLAGRDTEPLAGRLAAELLAVGLDVQREEPAADVAPDPVAIALRVRARAAVWVPPGTAAAEVWIIDREAARATLRQSITAEGDEMAPLVALRTAEFLRASLLGLPPAQPAPAPRPVPPVLSTPPVAEVMRAPRLSVALGAGVTASPGGVGVLPSIAAVVRAPLHGPLGAEALGLLSVAPAHTPRSSVMISLAGGGLSLRLMNGRRAVLDAGAGALGVFVHVDSPGSPTAVVGALYGRVGGGLAFRPWLGLRLDAIVGGAIARPSFLTAGSTETYASWGRPFTTGMLNLEARWF